MSRACILVCPNPECGCSGKVRQDGPWCQCQRCYEEFPAATAVQRPGPCACDACVGGNAYRMQRARESFRAAVANKEGVDLRVRIPVTREIEREMASGGLDG